jgi:hypothetical protein
LSSEDGGSFDERASGNGGLESLHESVEFGARRGGCVWQNRRSH